MSSSPLCSARSPTFSDTSSSSFFGFLHGADQYGRWVPQPVLKAKAILGGSTLDFSQALFVHPVITIRAHAFWGGVTLIVPPNVCVEQNGRAILGGFGGGGGVYARRRTGAMPSTALDSGIIIKIEGTAVMGAVTAAVNRSASPARLMTWEEASRIIEEVPAPESTTREDMRQQVICDALSQHLASAPPAAAAAIQHVMLQQGVNPTLLQNRQQLARGVVERASCGQQVAHGIVEGIPVDTPCK
eukprot:TRINITY_DN72963_c0_g1_i1.p1 TRINITY_DN72963_c0_g1~~TRINITY_DN72963_c0_g1_i1.p1  ORF type:complete len:266 (+),score=54.61 TRINITY_DN72963_c0_g1_i1:68-799(+)